ncbi:TetR/AcrR family transcriptional regulator [Neptunitalea lumnitzerae]|uniref:TetR family transcriptional regulator n=1 Tax=Neptunitalea lumnitzerae TaxID=2965509 RepID=A0ABQ5MHY6_9FLAO|nr:TetR/AcrR family transcriptional regulator [Neptunitalea sp. Y10]GLB49003.1 TetR family transcriptional regulator [Neptunitalea sp. Y10]
MKQDVKSEITKNLIVTKAFERFYQYGFNNTSIDTITSDLKLTKGAFYHHFKNKKELGATVIQQKIKDRILTGMIAPIYNHPDTPSKELLKLLFVERIQSFSSIEKNLGCPVNNFIHEIGNTDVLYQNALKNIIEEWQHALAELIEKGKFNKEIKQNINSNATALYLISTFEGVRGIRKLYNGNDIIINQYILALENYIDSL